MLVPLTVSVWRLNTRFKKRDPRGVGGGGGGGREGTNVMEYANKDFKGGD